MTCTQPGCGGTIQDGYCDACGLAAAAPSIPSASSGPSGPSAGSAGSAAWSGTSGTSGPTSGSRSSRSRSRRTSGRSARGRLGAGLVEIPPVPYRDPASAVLADPRVPEKKRFCSGCDQPVGVGRDGRPGPGEGFCRNCGTRFSFSPKLEPGDLVAGQYEVLGCIAFGGLGWIYLARDHNVSNRWVVLKGLLNTGDADAMAAAVAERQFLAQVEHPNIVRIYNFVQHADRHTGELAGYIVGYQAPEIETDGPSVSSDLFTVARALAVLTFDFKGFQSAYRFTLPDGVPLLEQQESFARLLLRATHRDPERRFASAGEMAEQLTGVLREVLAVADGTPRPAFSTTFSELPGEVAPKLALAFAAESAGQAAVAGHYFRLVWTVDRSCIGAASGLARACLATGDRPGAIAVLAAVPGTSSHHAAAQIAAVRLLVSGGGQGQGTRVSGDDLRQADGRLRQLGVDDLRREQLTVEILRAALDWCDTGQPAGKSPIVGCEPNARALRFGLERSYRALARLTPDGDRRIELVDMANAIRPRTLT